MIFALDALDRRVPPTKGERGRCPQCRRPVHAKCGEKKIHHWAHERGQNDCDPWAEGETQWHRDWQMRAPSDWCEVVMGAHRADIRRPDGLVIELQHSYITQEEVREREAFYGNMWWVFDTQPWKLRVRIATNGTAEFRWMSTRRTLDAANCPVYLDLGGPLLRVTGFGPRGCLSGSGKLVSRRDFIQRVGLRALSEEELRQKSHYSVVQDDGSILVARSIEGIRTWETHDGTATHYDLAGRTMVVKVPESAPASPIVR